MSKYSSIEREVLINGIMGITRVLYNLKDESLIEMLKEAKVNLEESKDDLWKDFIRDMEMEISKRKL